MDELSSTSMPFNGIYIIRQKQTRPSHSKMSLTIAIVTDSDPLDIPRKYLANFLLNVEVLNQDVCPTHRGPSSDHFKYAWYGRRNGVSSICFKSNCWQIVPR